MAGGAAKLTFAIRAVNEASAVLREVKADLGEVQAVAEQSSSRLGALGGALSGLGNSMMTVGKIAGAAMAGGLAGIGAGLASALKASGDFERGLNVVASVAQATGAELAGLKQVALELGESTAFSASEVLQAMEVLAANGISTSDIISGATKAALDLAAAGSTSLVQAADTVSTAMAVWNLSTEQLTDTVNRLAGAANVSRFGVEDMSLAIAQGGGAASAAGVSFQDFSAAIAAIAPLFASGSDAGTSFKTFLQRLVPDTKAASEAFVELGLITEDGKNKFFDASGKMKSMAEIAGILNEALNKLSDKDRTRLLSNAFGTDAMRTAIGLSRLTREEFEALQRSMGEASAAEIGAQRMKGFAGAIEQLKGAIETARIEIGDRLNPVATALAERLAELVPIIKDRLLSAMDWLGREVVPRVKEALAELRSVWERIEEPVMRFLGSQEALKIGLGMLAAVLMSVAVAAGAAAAGMLAAVAPVAALGLAIGGILIVADRLGVDWGKVWDGIRDVAGRAAEWIRAAVEGIAAVAGMVREHWGKVSGAVAEAFGAVRSAAQSVLGPVMKWIGEQISWLRNWWSENWGEIRTVAEAVWTGIRAAIETAVQVIRPIVEGVVQFLVGAWRAVGDDILANMRAVWQFIAAVIEFAVRDILLKVQLFLDIITGDWKGAWETLKQMFSNFVDFLKSAGQALWEMGKAILGGLKDGLVAAWDNLIWPWLSELGGKIVEQFSGMGGRMADKGRDLIQGLWDGAKSAWESVIGWAGGLLDQFLDALGDMANWLVDEAEQMMSEFWERQKRGWSRILGWVGGWMGEFLGAVGDMANWLVDKAEKMMTEFWEREKEGWALILGWVGGWMSDMLRTIGDAGRWLVDIGRQIIQGLWDGLKEKWEDVSGWVGGLGDKIKSLKGPPEKDRVLLYQIGQMIMLGLADGMGEGWEKDVVERLKDIGRGLIRNYQDVAEKAKEAGIPDWRSLGEVLTQALADGLFDRFKKNKPLLERVAAELVRLAEDTAGKVAAAVDDAASKVAAAPKIGIPANAPAGGYGPGDEMPLPGEGESYELGSDGRWYPKGKVPPDKQLVYSPPPPTGAHGKPLVWIESLKAWVESWMAPGLEGMSPHDWARASAPQPWSGPLSAMQPSHSAGSQPLQVTIEIDGRQVARAILPDLQAEAERQGVSL